MSTDRSKLVHGVNFRDHEIGCGYTNQGAPMLIASDLEKITCEDCKSVFTPKEKS